MYEYSKHLYGGIIENHREFIGYDAMTITTALIPLLYAMSSVVAVNMTYEEMAHDINHHFSHFLFLPTHNRLPCSDKKK